MNKEITITQKEFIEKAAEVASKEEFGLLYGGFVAKLTYELFDKEESETKVEEEQETKKEEFKPHLVKSRDGEKLGNIGEETPLTATKKQKLYVGDVVEIYDTESKQTYPLTQVCKNELGYWVMGLQIATLNELKNGKADEFRIKKVKSFEELQHGEIYHNTRVILKENENE